MFPRCSALSFRRLRPFCRRNADSPWGFSRRCSRPVCLPVLCSFAGALRMRFGLAASPSAHPVRLRLLPPLHLFFRARSPLIRALPPSACASGFSSLLGLPPSGFQMLHNFFRCPSQIPLGNSVDVSALVGCLFHQPSRFKGSARLSSRSAWVCRAATHPSIHQIGRAHV